MCWKGNSKISGVNGAQTPSEVMQMFQPSMPRTRIGSTVAFLELIFHATVRHVRKSNGNAIIGLLVSIAQSLVGIGVMVLMFSLIGLAMLIPATIASILLAGHVRRTTKAVVPPTPPRPTAIKPAATSAMMRLSPPTAQLVYSSNAALRSSSVVADFILSAEIMAIALNEVKSLAATSIWLEAGVLAFVAIAITIAVYGVVGVIVKMDDIGLHMAQRENGGSQAIGRGLVKGMPKLLAALSTIGTAAMLWVGGQIIVHGFGVHPTEFFGLHEGALAWIADAALCGVVGLAIGAVIVLAHHMIPKRKAH